MKQRQFKAFQYVSAFLEQALCALRDNKRRTTLSIIGIMMGIAAVVFIETISKGAHYIIFRELQTLGLKSVWVSRDHEEKSPNRTVRQGTGIDNDDLPLLKIANPALEFVTPLVRYPERQPLIQKGDRYTTARIRGVGTDYFAINNDTLVLGRIITRMDERQRKKVVVIGPDIRRDLFGKDSNPIGQTFRIQGMQFTVVGVLKPVNRDFLASIGSAEGMSANDRILMPYTTLQRMLDTRDINAIQAKSRSMALSETVASQIIRVLNHGHRSQYSYKFQAMAQYIKMADRILQTVTIIGMIAAGVSLLVGGLGIMNIMSTAVLERTREIGLRKASGARRRDIQFQFLLEAMLMSTVGGSLGLLIGVLFSVSLAIWTESPVVPSWITVVAALLVSVCVGVLSGYLPARRAALMQPADALRHE